MKKLVLFIAILLAFIITVHIANAIGLSVLPAFIKMNVIRGQQFNISITVNNPGTDETFYSIKTEDEFANWVSFYVENQSSKINQITVPATSSNKFIARFNIPKVTPNGKYSFSIYVETMSSENISENTGSVSIRVPIKVSFEVAGSQFLTGKVINITAADTEINRLLRIKTEFQNTGDVIATPRIEVAIKKNGAEIANFLYNNTSVNIDNTLIIDSDWDTTGQTVGDYAANVKVFLESKLISEENLNFKILERGTLTAEGKVEEVTASDEITTGQPAKIEVQFQNTGQIDLIAKISGEVYQNNNFVDTLQSDETLIRVGENETLTAYFKPTKDGSYLIKSNVVFEGKKEPISDISVNSVGEFSVFEMPALDAQSIVIIFVIVVLVLISVGIVYDKSKKSKNKN